MKKKKKVLVAGDSRGFISYYRHKFFIKHTLTSTYHSAKSVEFIKRP